MATFFENQRTFHAPCLLGHAVHIFDSKHHNCCFRGDWNMKIHCPSPKVHVTLQRKTYSVNSWKITIFYTTSGDISMWSCVPDCYSLYLAIGWANNLPQSRRCVASLHPKGNPTTSYPYIHFWDESAHPPFLQAICSVSEQESLPLM